MALSPQRRAVVLSTLLPKYRAMYEDGEISDDQLEAYANDTGIADFSGVQSDIRGGGPEEEPPKRSLDGSFGSRVREVYDSQMEGLAKEQEAESQALLGGLQRMGGSALYGITDSDVLSRGLGMGDRAKAWATGQADELLDASEASNKRSKAALDSMGPGAYRETAEAAADFLGSPSSGFSIIGGLAGTIPMADAYASEYAKARRDGLPKEEAAARATLMASAEAVSLVPAGKIGSAIFNKLGGKKALDQARDRAFDTASTQWVKKVAGGTLGEAVGEGTTAALQAGINEGLTYDGSKEQATYAEKSRSADVWEDIWRSFKAGAFGGATIVGSTAQLDVVAEAGRRAAEREAGVDQFNKPLLDKARSNAIPIDNTGLVGDGGSTPATRAKAFEKLEAERAQRREDEEESIIRTQRAREFAAANPDNVEAQLIAKGTITPEQIAKEREVDEQLNNELKAEFEKLRQKEADDKLAPLVSQAEKDIKDAKLKKLGKAKTKRAADLRKLNTSLLTQAEQLPEDQQARFIAENRKAWEEQNPVPTWETMFPKKDIAPQETESRQDSATIETQPAPTPLARTTDMTPGVVTAATAATQPAPGTMTEDAIREAARSSGLSSVSDTKQTKPGPKAEDIIAGIAKRETTTREGAVLSRMLADGKLAILDTASQAGAPEGSAGWFDGERMYLFADKVDPDNLKGSVMVVAAHEAKHAADLSGNPDAKVSMKNFVGDEANTKINAQIEQATNDPIAKKVRAKADKLNLSPEDRALEMPAYYAQYLLEQESRSSGLTSAGRSIVQAVKARYKQLTGDDSVGLKDIGYLAKKLTETLAVSRAPITADTKGLATIGAEGARTFAEAAAAGIPYQSADGRMRFIIEDNESTLFIDPNNADIGNSYEDRAKRQLSRLKRGDVLELDTIMDHEKLFKAYPELTRLPVSIMTPALLKKFGGYNGLFVPPAPGRHFGDVGSIYLNPDMLEDVSTFGPLHSLLLHETQHALQNFERLPDGATVKKFYTAEDWAAQALENQDKKALVRHSLAMINVGENLLSFNRGRLTDATAKRMASILHKDTAAADKGLEVFNLLNGHPVLDEVPGVLPLMENFETANNEFADSSNDMQARYAVAFRKYLADKGEVESRFTEYNMRRSLLEMNESGTTRDNNPEPVWKEDGGLVADILRYPEMFPAKVMGLASIADDTGDLINDAVAKVQGRESKTKRKALVSWFDQFHILGRPLKNQLELSESEASSIAYRAKGNYHRLERGIYKQALAVQRSGESLEAATNRVKGRINRVMEEVAGYDDIGRREAALARFVGANPELKPLFDALNDINEQSMRIVVKRAADPKPMSEKELAKFGAIVKNKYTYLTRTFAAFQGEAGREWTQRLVREAELGRKQAAAGKGVSKKYQSSMSIYSNAVSYVIENEVFVTDPAVLHKKDMEGLEYLHSLWGGDTAALKKKMALMDGFRNEKARNEARKDIMIAEMVGQMNKAEPYQVEKRAHDIVLGMLGLQDNINPISTYYRGLKEDRSILETKQEIPAEIRALFGEITDWPTRVAITLSKQGELVARMSLLNWMRTSGSVVDEQTKLNNPEFAEYTEGLAGEAWGPLDGMFTTPDIKLTINDGVSAFTSLSEALAGAAINSEKMKNKAVEWAGDKIVRVAKLQKFMSIVVSPFAMMANALGSPLVLVQHGVTNPKHVLRAGQAAVALVMNQLAPSGVPGTNVGPQQVNPDLELFLKYGLFDSAIAQEIRRTPQHFLRELVKQTEGVTTYQEMTNAFINAKDKASELRQAWTEIFAMSDAWVKPAVFLSRVDFLEKINRLEDKGWTQEDIYSQASDYTKDTTITFLRAAPIVKSAETIGLTTFAPYFQTVFRSLGYTFSEAIRDLGAAVQTDNKAAQLAYAIEGAKKLTGVGLASTGAVAATGFISSVLNDDDDEEMLEGAKKMLFPEGRFGHGIYLGKDKKGFPLLFRFGRLDPFGPFNDLIRIATTDDMDKGEKNKAIMESVQELWIANRAVGNIMQFTMDYVFDAKFNNKTTKSERMPWLEGAIDWSKTIAEKAYTLDSSDAESMVQFADSFVPGWTNVFDETNKATSSPTSVSAEIVGLFTWLSGGRLDKADPGLAASIAVTELNELRKTARSDIFQSSEARGDAAAMSQFTNYLQDEQEAFNRVQEIYEGMLQMGMSANQAAAVLKDAKLEATDMGLVRQGRRTASTQEWGTKYSRLLSEQSLTKSGEYKDRGLTEAEQKEAEKERKETVKRLMLFKKEGK